MQPVMASANASDDLGSRYHIAHQLYITIFQMRMERIPSGGLLTRGIQLLQLSDVLVFLARHDGQRTSIVPVRSPVLCTTSSPFPRLQQCFMVVHWRLFSISLHDRRRRARPPTIAIAPELVHHELKSPSVLERSSQLCVQPNCETFAGINGIRQGPVLE